MSSLPPFSFHIIFASTDSGLFGDEATNQMPWGCVKEDLQYFKNVTKDHVIVMGKNTYLSFPHKKKLPFRTNIVLTRNIESCKKEIASQGFEEPDYFCQDLGQIQSLGLSQQIFLIGGKSLIETYFNHPHRGLIYWTKLSVPNLIHTSDSIVLSDSITKQLKIMKEEKPCVSVQTKNNIHVSFYVLSS